MDETVKQLLWAAGFKYQEESVVNRLVYHLSTGREACVSLQNRLHFLREAASEWVEYGDSIFITASIENDTDSLCVITGHGIPVAWLRLPLLNSVA